jgi:hypothetical protein
MRGDEAADCFAMTPSFLYLNGVIGGGVFPDEAERHFKTLPPLYTVRIRDAVKRRDMERGGALFAEAEKLLRPRNAAREDPAPQEI